MFTVMFAWEIFVEFFASYNVLRLINIYHLDKILHLIGGAFIMGLLSFTVKDGGVLKLLLLALLGALIWELSEVLFDQKVQYFFSHRRSFWLEDTVGDIVFTIIGAWLYRALVKKVDER